MNNIESFERKVKDEFTRTTTGKYEVKAYPTNPISEIAELTDRWYPFGNCLCQQMAAEVMHEMLIKEGEHHAHGLYFRVKDFGADDDTGTLWFSYYGNGEANAIQQDERGVTNGG